LSSESYRVSDVTLMLNNQPPIGKPKIFYSNELVKKDLGVNFFGTDNNHCQFPVKNAAG